MARKGMKKSDQSEPKLVVSTAMVGHEITERLSNERIKIFCDIASRVFSKGLVNSIKPSVPGRREGAMGVPLAAGGKA